MAFFEFPHTRTYDSDLGWLIKAMKEAQEAINLQNATINEYNGRVEAVEELAENLKQFVNNYFDNLDVQTEINNKIDAMAADGSLLELIRTPVETISAEMVAEWLQDHITPTTPPIDSSLTVSGAAADAKAAGDAITELKNDIGATKLFDIVYPDILRNNSSVVVVPDYINNTVVTATGEVGTPSTKRITNKSLIYIPDGATFNLLNSDTENYYNPNKFCFDANGEFISNINGNTPGLAAGTYYVRLSASRKDNGTITPEDALSVYTITIAKTTLPDLVDDIISEAGFNKYNPDKKTNGYIASDEGYISTTQDYFTSDFIDVSDFTLGYAFTPKARKILFYDANKTAITDSYYTDETSAGVIALNAAYKYMRLSWYRTSTDIMVCDAASLPAYEPYEIIAKDGINYLNSDTKAKVRQMVGEGGKSTELATYLNGKTVAVFGDSIMYGAGSVAKGPGDYLAEKYGMKLKKYCVSGATMGIRTDAPQYTVDEVHHIAKQVRNAIAENITPDLIIFDGGTNDIGGEIPIGTITDVYTEPVSEAYFADGFETVAYLLMKNYVGVPIIYMRAHNMSSLPYAAQVQYGELGNQMAEKWGIRTVDMYKRMNTQLAEYRTAYLADYTHPNAAGYEKYYIPAIEDFVFTELV